MAQDDHVPATLEAVLAYLTRELPALMTSGENWQVVLHGGRNGDVVVEQLRKATVVRREQSQKK